MNKNILLCGVGGQGIVLTSKLIAAASMTKNIPVMSAETIGMAQKGGSVFSFLRMGDELYCPMLPEGTADLIIGFEPGEAVRMLPYLKPEGSVILNSHPIMPVTAALNGGSYNGQEMVDYLRANVKKLYILDGDAVCRKIGSPKVLNMVMLGAAAISGCLPFTLDEIKEAVKNTVNPKFFDLNCMALDEANKLFR
ncbi:MAG: indolepyruvate oxidoreductase subunit beta [Oscillospiraceae bacterium]